MLKKDLGLFLLIVVVGSVVAILNPRFLSPINLGNTANLIGLFGLFSHRRGHRHHHRRHRAVGRLDLRAARRDLRRPAGRPGRCPGGWRRDRRRAGAASCSAPIHGFLDHPAQAAAVHRHAVRPADLSRHRALLHQRRHGRLRVRPELPDAGMADGRPHAWACRIPSSCSCVVAGDDGASCCTARSSAAISSRSARTRRRRAISGIHTTRRHRGRLHHLRRAGRPVLDLSSPSTRARSRPPRHGNFYELYGIAAAVLGGCSLRGGEGSILGIVLGAILLQVLQNLVNLLGIPSSLNFAVMGTRDPDRRPRRPAAHAVQEPANQGLKLRTSVLLLAQSRAAARLASLSDPRSVNAAVDATGRG